MSVNGPGLTSAGSAANVSPFLLEPPFTADRTYLHGADIFEAIVDRLGPVADLRLTLTVASDCAIEVCDLSESDGRSSAAVVERCGTIGWRAEGARRQLDLVRRRDRPIARRVSLDEGALIEGATFEGDRAALPAGDAPLMRRVAAASLHLLRLQGPRQAWAIAEIACARVPSRSAPASVTLSRLLGGRYWKATATSPDGGGTMLLARGGPQR